MANISKEPYYMTFYKDLSLLHSIHNKQSLFFAQVLSRMDGEQVVCLTPRARKQIMLEIDSKSKNPLATARQMLSKLVKENLIVSMGGGDYMVNPKLYGYSNIRNTINNKHDIFMKLRYSQNDKKIILVGKSETNVNEELK